MKKIINSLLLLAFTFLPLTNAFAEKLTLVAGPFPPYHYWENNKQVGVNVELAEEVFRRIGVEAEFKTPLSFQRALKAIETGDADAFVSLIYVKDLAKYMYYSKEPVNILKTVIFARKGSGLKIDKFEDLKGKTIGVVKGYSYGDKFNKSSDLKKQIYADDQEVIRALAYGRIDLAAAHEAPFNFISKQIGVGDKLETAHVLLEEPMFVTFSKKLGEKKARELIGRFDKALKQLKDETAEKK